jgi:hypothetical protein
MSYGIKKENPMRGVYQYDLTKNKRSLTESHSRARFFRIIRPNGSKTRWYEIPEDHEKAKEKRIYIKAFLVGYHQTLELKKEARRLRYAALREAQGKSYKSKTRKVKPQKALRISKAELESIERLYGEEIRQVKKTFRAPEETKYVVSENEFEGRIKKLIKKLREEYKQAGQNFDEVAIYSRFRPTSMGKATPFIKGQPSNWRDLQKEIGIKDEESINWVVTRYIRRNGIPFFKAMAKKYPKMKEFYYVISMTTNLKEHDHFLRGNTAEEDLNVLVNLRFDKEFLWSKRHIAQIEWRFVQTFMRTLYRGDGELFNSGALTSSGAVFKQMIGEKTKKKSTHPTKNFDLVFFLALADTAK